MHFISHATSQTLAWNIWNLSLLKMPHMDRLRPQKWQVGYICFNLNNINNEFSISFLDGCLLTNSTGSIIYVRQIWTRLNIKDRKIKKNKKFTCFKHVPMSIYRSEIVVHDDNLSLELQYQYLYVTLQPQRLKFTVGITYWHSWFESINYRQPMLVKFIFLWSITG